jgi:hypothetical protein
VACTHVFLENPSITTFMHARILGSTLKPLLGPSTPFWELLSSWYNSYPSSRSPQKLFQRLEHVDQKLQSMLLKLYQRLI